MHKEVGSQTRPSDEELKALSDSFESKQPQEVLAYALACYFPSIVLACSFGAEDVALVDMIHRINPRTPLFY
ncbi:MAG: phosphoadenylyl-sulfate reductase, partial [Nitrospiraceae bacterium]